MARGWESKNVEEQIAEASTQTSSEKSQKERLTTEETESARKRLGLELALKRIHHDLSTCSNERHRAMLQAAKAELERQLAAL